ncbi:MAG: hypothetical protein AAGJ10_18915 [Bacteroidota bacterium]
MVEKHHNGALILSYGPKRADIIFLVLFATAFFGMGALVMFSTESFFERMIGLLFCAGSCLLVEQEANWTYLLLEDQQMIVKRGPLPSFFRWKPVLLESIESMYVAYVIQSKQEFYAVLLHTPDGDVGPVFRAGDKQHAVDIAQYIVSRVNQIAPTLVLRTSISGRSYYSETDYEWVRQPHED